MALASRRTSLAQMVGSPFCVWPSSPVTPTRSPPSRSLRSGHQASSRSRCQPDLDSAAAIDERREDELAEVAQREQASGRDDLAPVQRTLCLGRPDAGEEIPDGRGGHATRRVGILALRAKRGDLRQSIGMGEFGHRSRPALRHAAWGVVEDRGLEPLTS